jgi:hypothetical protein
VPQKHHDSGTAKRTVRFENTESSLIRARNTIYQHIKNTSVTEGSFFIQQDKNHKRELVAIMRRIDNREISTAHDLLRVMQHLAIKHQSEKMTSILNVIQSLLDLPKEAEISLLISPKT